MNVTNPLSPQQARQQVCPSAVTDRALELWVAGNPTLELWVAGIRPLNSGWVAIGPLNSQSLTARLSITGVQGSDCLSPGVQGSDCLSPGVQGSDCLSPGVQGSDCLSPGVQGSDCLSPGVQGSDCVPPSTHTDNTHTHTREEPTTKNNFNSVVFAHIHTKKLLHIYI